MCSYFNGLLKLEIFWTNVEYWNQPELLQNNNFVHFKKVYKQKLMNMYTNQWANSLQLSSKCLLYRNFNKELKFEKYLIVLPKQLMKALIRFRTSNHSLPIETGRYVNVERKDRICTLCISNNIGDECHYFINFCYFDNLRKEFIPKVCIKKPSVQKFCEVMQSKNRKLLVKIARFCSIICNKFQNV